MIMIIDKNNMMTKKTSLQYKVAYHYICFCTGKITRSTHRATQGWDRSYVQHKTQNIFRKIFICVDKQLPESDWSSSPSAGARVAGARGDGDATRRDAGVTPHKSASQSQVLGKNLSDGIQERVLWFCESLLTVELYNVMSVFAF